MATYVNDLRLKEITTGDEAGTWGTSTNTNLELIAEAFSYGTEASFGSDADATTTIADGATDPARSLYLKITSGVSLTATRTLTIAPNTVSKVWIIENATSGSQSISISQGSGANVTIPNGDVKVIYTDGAGSGAAVVDAFTDLNTSGTLTATNLVGTLTTAAQTNITSVGTLTGLDVAGTPTFDGLTVDGATTITKTGTNASPHIKLTESGDTREFNIYNDGSGNGRLVLADTDDTPDTEIVLADNGIITMNTANTERMRIRSDGGVGIGQAGYASTILSLHNGTGRSTLIYGESGDANCDISLRDNSSTQGIKYGAVGNNHVFKKDSTEHMRIDSSGNVGIGTTSPAVPFHVSSNNGAIARFANNSATDTTSYITVINANDTSNGTVIAHLSDGTSYIGNQQNNALKLVTNDTERMHIDSSGNVGIGDSSPAAKLEIKQGSGNWYEGIRINRSSNTTQFGTFSNNSGATFIGAADSAGGNNNAIIFGNSTNGTTFTERMRITSGGNVGIGTTSPATNFHISVDGAYNELARIEQTQSSRGSQLLFKNAHNSTHFIGIAGDSSGDVIHYNGAATNSLFYTNATERMRIDSSGNVGIGATPNFIKVVV